MTGRTAESRQRARDRDGVWCAWVALLPVLLLACSILGALVMNDFDTSTGDVLATWNVAGVFGLLFYGPAMAVSLYAALVLEQNLRTGRWLASVGSAGTVLVFGFLGYTIVSEAVAPEMRDPYGWAPVLSPFTASLAVAPYIAIVLANSYVVVRLWRRRAE
ncbi:hypothetical protein [Nocardia otitidiscaviarum]|uniref:hypothetical protein n=1 Tax=Nocardia otitidiscaviarum TaxID=1823 RepID=UPI00189344ED|nr:hypothetical protein [Nocardia otitidiscaviarum]MBF6181338.1 hypothetical protein [Nocardia otitidiscaviarum]